MKKTVEALPFTAEGYNRAKSILKSTYRKESEVVKAYTKEIMKLPHISNANPKKIHEFYETRVGFWQMPTLHITNSWVSQNGEALNTPYHHKAIPKQTAKLGLLWR